MFYIVGQRVRTEPVGTRERILDCRTCGFPRRHAEHRLVRAATLFFVPLANVTEQTVWCCERCGTRISEGPLRLPSEQGDTAVGQALGALDQARHQAGPALERLKAAAEEAYRTAEGAVQEAMGAPEAPPPDAEPEPPPVDAHPPERPPRKRRL